VDVAGGNGATPRELAEAALAHTLKDKVEAAYQRGDLLEKRRRLMAEWASFSGRPMEPHLHITPGLALRSDNIPAAFSAHSDLPPVTVKLLRLQYDGYLRAGDSGRASRRDPFVTKQSKSWHSRCHHPRFTDEPAVTKSEIFVAPTVAEAKAALGIGTTRLYELLTPAGCVRASSAIQL